MGKLVRFNVGKGDFQSGFEVTLQIFEEGKPGPIAETEGRLPPARELPAQYDSWRKYHGKKVRGRSSTRITVKGSTEKETLAEIKEAKEQLHLSVNNWLNPHEKDFSPIWTEILKTMRDEDEEIRFIVKTTNQKLQQLPWYIWDEFFDRYRRAEVCLYLPVTTRKLATPRDRVKVLAVLGKQETIGTNTRIEIEEDWKTLQQHLSQESNAELIRLPEPTLEELCQKIDGEQWRCLFFAGHSSSEEDGTRGQIELNNEDSITIDDLKYALRNAVDRGLQLVIFNSCDGLGIAQQLASLHIPNIIVMREPVPDEVAQKFLQHFLEAFAAGEPLHIVVRKAREKINHLERKFPGAIWLPMLFQNPAEAPLTWRSLGGVEVQRESNQVAQPGEGSEAENQSSIVSVSSEVNKISEITSIQNKSPEVRDISKRGPKQPLAKEKKSPKFYITRWRGIGLIIYVLVYGFFVTAPQLTKNKEEYQMAPSVFSCRIINKVPTTIVEHPDRGEVEFIRWIENYGNQSPLDNCREVSARFDLYKVTGVLIYIVPGIWNNSHAICASISKNGPCQFFLFKISHEKNPQEIIRHIEEINRNPDVPPIEL